MSQFTTLEFVIDALWLCAISGLFVGVMTLTVAATATMIVMSRFHHLEALETYMTTLP